MEKKEKETGRRISESLTKVSKKRKEKKNTKIKSIDPAEKTENWFVKIFYRILYYRSEGKPYSSTGNHPKVKLPRSRHK